MSQRGNKPIPEPGAAVSERDQAADERRTLVQRVAQDESFRRAPRLRELLIHFTEKAIEGRPEELNEHEIAITVFRRAGTFNSADDSIVRSSARQLRTKLHEYFEGPGRDEPVIIEIPKGSYVPEFPNRPVFPAQPAPSPAQESAQPWKRIAICCAAGIVVLAALLVGSLVRPIRGSAPKARPNLVTWLFGGRSQEVNVVVCDSALVVVNAYRAHMLGLDEYIQQLDQQPLPLPGGNSGGATPTEFPGKRLITSFRDMVFVSRLSEHSVAAGFGVQLRHSRLMQVRDFRSGSHIVLGSPWSNPWASLFEEKLNFRFGANPSDGSFGLQNTHPEKNELAFYSCTPSQARNGLSYARVAVLPNLSGFPAELLVSGLHTESSEGALDAALSPAFLNQVRQIANAVKPDDLMGLELLLEIRAVDGVVHDTRLLASRQHH
jgi:hypothetical protein